MKKVMLFFAVAAFAVAVNAQDSKMSSSTAKPATKSDSKMATKPAMKSDSKMSTKTTATKPAAKTTTTTTPASK